jgi:hypothetical protein
LRDPPTCEKKAHLPNFQNRFVCVPPPRVFEIAIFPSGKLRRPEKKLKTSRGFWRGDGAEH